MTKLISTLLCLSLAVPAHSGEQLDRAKATAQASHVLARQHAMSYVRQDLSKAFEDVLIEAQKIDGVTQMSNTITLKRDDLIASLEQLTALDANSTAQAQATVLKVVHDYQETVRQRFSLSFAHWDAAENVRRIPQEVKNILKSAEAMCRQGRSTEGNNYISNVYTKLPETYYSYYFGYGNEGQEFRAGSANSSNSNASETRNGVNTVAQTGAGLVVSIGLSGAGGPAVAACAAAAPYAVAAAIVIAAAVDYLNAEEQAQIQNDITDGQRHIVQNSASDSDVAQYYRESCQENIVLFEEMHGHVESLSASSNYRTTSLKGAEANRQERLSWEKESEENRKLQTIYQLALRSLQGECDEGKKGTPEQACYSESGNYRLTSDAEIYIEKDQKKQESIIEDIRTKMLAYQQKYTKQIIKGYIMSQLTELMAGQIELIEDQTNFISFTEIDALQKTAFNKIRRVITLHAQLSNKKALQEGASIQAELDIVKKFEMHKKNVRHGFATIVRFVLQRATKAEVEAELTSMKTELLAFTKRYYHVPEVRDLESSYNLMIKTFETL